MGENFSEKNNSSKEILIELLKNSLSQSLTNLENRNNEEIFLLENSKKFFDEYNITIDKMLKELDEIEKKIDKIEIKEDKKENKKEDKKIEKKQLNKKEEKKEKEKKLISKKENEKKEKEKEKEKKSKIPPKKESKKMTRSQTLTNLKEKKEEVHYMNTEPSFFKPKEKKKKMMIRSKTERTLKSNNNNNSIIHNKSNIKNTTFPNKKFNTIHSHNFKNEKKNYTKKNAAYYLKIYCKENWFENILSYLPLKDRNNLILSSKTFKQYHIERLNKIKKLILKISNIEEGETIEDKIKEYKSKYSEEELNKTYTEFQMSKGTIKAIELLNNEDYTKIFHQNILENELNEIYIVYRCFCYLINEIEIA